MVIKTEAVNWKDKAILFDSAIICVIIIAGIICQYLANALLGRALGAKNFGDYRVSIYLLLFFGQTLIFGLDVVSSKMLPLLLRENNIVGVTSFIRTILIMMFKIIGYTFIVGGLIFIGIHLAISLNKSFANYVHLGYDYLLFAGIISLFIITTKLVRGINYRIFSGVLLSAQSLVLLILIYICSIKSIHYAIFITIAAYCIVSVIGVSFLVSKFKILTTRTLYNLSGLFKSMRHFWYQQLLSSWWMAILLFITAMLPGSKGHVGQLASDFTITDLTFIPILILRMVFQTITAEKMNDKPAELRKYFNFVTLVSVIFMFIFLVILYYLTPELLKIYGGSYHHTPTTNFLAVASNFCICLIIGNERFLDYREQYNRKLTYLLLIALMVLIISGYYLITKYGVVGGLYAFAITQTFASGSVLLLRIKLLNKECHLAEQNS